MVGQWTVSEVARMAHVTVRALHHYDDIGLLVPSSRTNAGYRLYDVGDLERLQQILLYRELEFPLDGIARMLEEAAPDRALALRAQRELLAEKARRLESILGVVDRMLESMERRERMSAAELFEGFGALDAPDEVKAQEAKHREEVQERWGDTDAYRESMRRTRKYTQRDWAEIKAESESIEADMAVLLAAGEEPGGEAAMAVAERHRQHISRWFYPCRPAMHAGLADMYEADPRFSAHYEARARGLAAFTAAAVRANARRG